MFRNIPSVTRNLLFLNIIIFMMQLVGRQNTSDWLTELFGLHFYLAPHFHWWQPLTYMFLHASWSHVLLNMLSLWMFGRIIETHMGQKRFLVYYLVCGIGAALCQELWQMVDYYWEELYKYDTVAYGNSILPMKVYLNSWNTIGASGATYGVLLAFGMTYPEERIMMLFPPIPMKAKYFVMVYAAIELFSAFFSNSNVAHFAHLGGMFFGWLLIRQWRKQTSQHNNAYYNYNPQKQNKTIWQNVFHSLQQLYTQFAQLFTHDKQKQQHQNYFNQEHAYNARKRAEQLRIDAILDKVRRSGYASLTEEEKHILFQNSKK